MNDPYDDKGFSDACDELWKHEPMDIVNAAGGAEKLILLFMSEGHEKVTAALEVACGDIVRGDL